MDETSTETEPRVWLKNGRSFTTAELAQALEWLYENRTDAWADMVLSVFAPGLSVRRRANGRGQR